MLEFGRDRPPGRRLRTRVLLGCALAAVGLMVVFRVVGHEAQAKGRHAAAGTDVGARLPPVRIVSVGHRLLGIRAHWQLFARGPDDLLRIQFARGIVTWTYVPPLVTASPAVALIVGAHQTVIQPADVAPGYVVPDGRQARPLTGPLSVGGPIVPGPAGTQTVWVTTGPVESPRLSLVTLAGHRVGPSIQVPPEGSQVLSTAVADGLGGVLLTSENYADYDVGPHWDHAEPGTIIAVGAGSWLTEVCDAPGRHCRYEVIDAAGGHRRVLPAAAAQSPYYFTWPPAGVISPGGGVAAIAADGSGNVTTVHLVNLRTGASKDLGIQLAESDVSAQGTMIWSPDGRWLFAVTFRGNIVAIDARTDRVESIGTSLPRVSELAIRE